MAVLRRSGKFAVDWYDKAGKRHRKTFDTKSAADKQNRTINAWKRLFESIYPRVLNCGENPNREPLDSALIKFAKG